LAADYRGASIITSTKNRFLWAISARNLWTRTGERVHLNYEGIGGGVEPTESFEDAAIRECIEETGCQPRLLISQLTFMIDDIKERPRTIVDAETHPFMIWRKKVRGQKTLLAYTYLARIEGTPQPKAEVPALLYTPADVLRKRGTMTVGELLDNGSELVERTRIPRPALISPWGTPVYLRALVSSGKIDFGTLTEVR
jgi:ADP-ribose pyrophosphatase YjhB (NUDIX family)